MTAEQAVPILARWVNELTWELRDTRRKAAALEGRVQRLEHAARERALSRRHWIRTGQRERI